MRHPSELFIISLLVDGRSTEDVNGLLSEYGLPQLLESQDVYLAELRMRVQDLKPKKFSGGSGEDREYLKQLNVDGLYHPDTLVSAATALNNYPALQKELMLALLGRVDLTDLARHVADKYDYDVDMQTLRVYRHYYFNPDLISYGDWGLFFESLPNQDDVVIMNSCLNGGPIVAAHRIGIERNTTIKDAVNEVVQSLYVTLHEIKNWPASPAKIKMLSDTMGALARAHNVVNTSDQELAAIAAELKRFKLAKNVEKPKPLAMLSKKVNYDRED